ncbi:radical SAM protein [Lacrimispora sp. BS-2]|uniref:Radical SAM protein n=1 Tax=Lacrimispora sp. BS-2 TaxID=3151850 RepID=A0AAU7PNL7_9FIRM
MAKIKRLVLGLIPNQKCNLKCEYCYISQVEAWDEPTSLKFSPKHISKCLSKERLGGISLINLTGNGETMLQPDIVELIGALLQEGHYVEVVTNGTVTKHINKVLEYPEEWLSRLFFKISFHYKELKRLNIMDKFFDNVKAIHNAGASFSLELMAYDEIEKDIEDIKAVCKKNVGAVCQATIGRNDKRKDKGLLSKHSNAEFRAVWKSLDSDMMDFKLKVIGIKRKEFCYAGSWSLFVNMYTGESQPCYWQPYNQNLFKNPDKPIKFVPVGYTCTQPYCTNAHAHMTWGIIPELRTPTYCSMRNRKCDGGEEWLTSGCKEFFSSRLWESNKEYTKFDKFTHTISYPFRLIKWFLRDYKNNVRRLQNYMKRIDK